MLASPSLLLKTDLLPAKSHPRSGELQQSLVPTKNLWAYQEGSCHQRSAKQSSGQLAIAPLAQELPPNASKNACPHLQNQSALKLYNLEQIPSGL